MLLRSKSPQNQRVIKSPQKIGLVAKWDQDKIQVKKKLPRFTAKQPHKQIINNQQKTFIYSS